MTSILTADALVPAIERAIQFRDVWAMPARIIFNGEEVRAGVADGWVAPDERIVELDRADLDELAEYDDAELAEWAEQTVGDFNCRNFRP